jgi:hypothetical protein
MKGHFSDNRGYGAIALGEQVILFQNRRGYSVEYDLWAYRIVSNVM